VTDVLYHQLLDARALVAFATPVTEPADRDDVSYWSAFAPKGGEAGNQARNGAAAHARFVRVAASAYLPGSLARAWSETAAAVCRAARACPAAAVATQGYVLCPADFTATLAVETAVHYLDLTVSLPSAPPPDPARQPWSGGCWMACSAARCQPAGTTPAPRSKAPGGPR
jgi:hypothetical protein